MPGPFHQPLRVLVTGSRAFDDQELMRRVLTLLPPGSTVVHGAARGADALADRVAAELDLVVEAHPAEWRRYGRGAGLVRSAVMVAAGADLCVAFPVGEARGTRHCMTCAHRAGIPVWNVTEDDRPAVVAELFGER